MRIKTLVLALMGLFVSIQALAQDNILCYASSGGEAPLQTTDVYTPPIDSIPLSSRHWLALRASGDVYTLPDLENGLAGEAFVQRFESFMNNVVPGYKLWAYNSDRATGLKYMVLEPMNMGEPFIFAFAGTQSTLDTFADLSMGIEQVKVIERFVTKFLDCSAVDSQGRPLASHNWLITGHSLGGGMAQIFAYLTQSLRLLMRMPSGRVELVTFNGFGAKDVALGGSPFTDIVEPGILAYNYYVTSDPVSKIGTHIGATYELPMSGAGVNPAEILRRHALSTIESIVVTGNYVDFGVAVQKTPPYAESLNSLKGVGSWLGFLADNHSDNLTNQIEQRNTLFNAANVLFDRRLGGSLDLTQVNYLKRLAYDFQQDLKAQAQNGLRDEIIADLDRLLAVLSKY